MATVDPLIDRGLPANPDAEKAVLGAILLDNSAYNAAAPLVRPEDFAVDSHRRIFQQMVKLSESSKPIDFTTLAEELIASKELEAVGGVAYLASLTDGLPRAVNTEHYARIVKDKSVLRRLIHTSNSIMHQCLEGAGDVTELLDRAESAILAVGEERIRTGLMPLGEIFKQGFRSMDELLNRGQRITGLETGFRGFDELTCGLQPADLILVAARPSMGKTAWALNVAQHAALHAPRPQTVGIFSLEMTKEALFLRLVCSEARVNSHKFRSGFLSKDELHRIADATGHLAASPIFIDDTPGLSLYEMRAKARRLKAESAGTGADLGLIILDYIQLMNTPKAENRNQEISALSRGLKSLAKELNVPLMALSQLSRAPEQRGGEHRPQLSDLRDSGCLAGETLVTLADTGRRVPIRELEGRCGFSVLALNEATMRLEATKVSRAFCTGLKPVLRMTTQLGRSILATGNHPFRLFQGWARLDTIKPGDHLALPRVVNACEERQATMREAEVALLGHLIGDGCTLEGQPIHFTTQEPDLASLVADLGSEVFGGEVQPRICRERSWLQVYLPSTRTHTHGVKGAIREWLEELDVFDLRSPEKRVPSRLFEQPRSTVAEFLSHLWSTDGHVGRKAAKRGVYPNVFYATSSERLARDVQSLLLRVGVVARLVRVPQPGKGRDQFHVSVSGQSDLAAFLQVIQGIGERRSRVHQELREHVDRLRGNTNRDVIPSAVWRDIVHPARRRLGMSDRQLQAAIGQTYCGTSLYRQNVSRERATRLAEAIQSPELAALASSDVYWDRVVSIEPEGEQNVYDLSVPGPHNFIANDFVAHNSLEQDADVVNFLYREDYYLKMTGREVPADAAGRAELIIGKQRNGPTGKVIVAFLDSFARFDNIAEGFE